MSLTTHHRAVRATPCYGPSHTVMRKRDDATFPCAFRRARIARVSDEAVEAHASSRQSGSTSWSAAFAILLVTNFVTSASASPPRALRNPSGRALARDGRDDLHGAPWPNEVVAEALPQVQVKSQYSPVDVLRAVAAARMPFANFGESMSDAYSLMTGRDVPHKTRETIKAWGTATGHMTDDGAQEAIHNAFADLSRLHLIRSNRPDLRGMRDNSIIDHRAALRVVMRDIDQRRPLVKQQSQVAEATARYYYSHPFAEAFCQENAEILFHFLLQGGVSVDQLRMITVQPKNRAPHVMVLFTESHRFIDMLDALTPRLRESLRPDGLSSGQFAWAAYMTRDSTLLLDPWSRNKAISLVSSNEQQDVVNILEVAFADIGHRTDSPYTVSITRPLASRRSSPGSQSSLGSSGSSGTGRASRAVRYRPQALA